MRLRRITHRSPPSAGVQPDAVSRNSAGAALAAAGRWRKAFFAVEGVAGEVVAVASSPE